MPERQSVDTAEAQSYLDQMQGVLAPLARLMIGKGVTYPMLDALLQRAYVQAALEGFVAEGEKPTASRLYMLTGIHRKKIAPLLDAAPAAESTASRPLSLRVRDRITSNPACMDRQGRIKPLPVSRREGGEFSFEAIVESVSRDVRPRAILDQWLKAKIGHLDAKGRLVLEAFTPMRGQVPGEGAARLNSMLRPVVNVLADYSLERLTGGGWVVAEVGGLSRAAAIELAAENRKAMRELLARFNRRAEQRARADLRARRGGECTVHAGGFQWIDGVQGTPPADPEPVIVPRAKPNAAPRRRPKAASAARTRTGR
jgi:Family of unknown function (DUF6502)